MVNKGEYGGKRDDVVVTNLDLTRVFLKWKQYEEDVPSFAKAVKHKYESLVANVGNMPFGENMMLAIMFSEQNKNVGGGSPIEVTMKDYYDGTVEERKVWNETYMNFHLTRKLITGCANEDDRGCGKRFGQRRTFG